MATVVIPGWGSKRRAKSPADLLLNQLFLAKLPAPLSEVEFHPTRKWAFDFAYKDQKLAIEIEGGTWKYRHGGKSRHTTGSGYQEDCHKYNEAALLGWRVLRFTPNMIDSGLALNQIERGLKDGTVNLRR